MQWKIAASVTKFAVAYTKFAFDNLILGNGGAAVADLAGCLTVCPIIDLKEFWAPMLGLKGTNKGKLQADLQYRDGTTGGFVPLVEALGHIANGAALVYDIVDLIDNFSSGKPNMWSVASDFLSLASLATYYLYRFLGNNAPRALLYIAIGLGVMSFGAAVVANFPPPGPSSPSDGGDNRKQDGFGGGGGGFPPLPPLIPVSWFLQSE